MAFVYGPALVKKAKAQVGRRAYSSMCQAFCVITSGIDAKGDFDGDGDADAVDGWKKAKARGKVVEAKDIRSLNDIPAGTLAYWTGGSRGYGHVAITIGGGKIVSTDAPAWGTIGIVGIDFIAAKWRNNLKFVGYILNDGDDHQFVVPKKRPAQWYRIADANLGLLNGFGEKTGKQRLPAVVKKIAGTKAQVVTVQELKGSFVDLFDDLMSTKGYRRVSGGLSRYVYAEKAIPVVASKLFDLQPRYKGDTKQAAGAILEIDGHRTCPVSGHLENEDDSGSTQVKQGLSEIDQVAPWAASHGCGKDRIVHAVDTNSDNRVRVEAFGKRGYSDAAEIAYESIGSRLGTFLDWRKSAVAGPSIDLIAVGPGRPVRRYFVLRPGWLKSTNSNALDHLIVCADIGKQV